MSHRAPIALPLAHRFIAVALAAMLIVAAALVAPPAANAAGTRTISGTIAAPAGVPSTWAQQVRVYAQQGSSGFEGTINATAKTFSVTGLEPGTYTVHFYSVPYKESLESDASVSNGLLDGAYGATFFGGAGTPVNVSTASVTNLKHTFLLGRTISGTISMEAGSPPAWKAALGVTVEVNCDTCGPFGISTIDGSVNPSTGAYIVRGLPPGAYRVQFWTGGGVSPQPELLDEYYKNSHTWEGATLVNVASANAANINATLERWRSISGTVTLPGGVDAGTLGGILVVAQRTTGAERTTHVDPDGTYEFEVLEPGQYTIHFEPGEWYDGGPNPLATPLAPQYYSSAASPAYTAAGATKVSVTNGSVTDINQTLTVGRTISGTVTAGEGTEQSWLGNARAFVSSPDQGYRAGSIDPVTGAYVIEGLIPASFAVGFLAESYFDDGAGSYVNPLFAHEFYNNARTPAGADPVNVASGNVLGIDATLDLQASDYEFYTTPNPVIIGTPHVGQQLTAGAGVWQPGPSHYSHQWYRDGVRIDDAIWHQYTVTAADAGRSLTVEVTAHRDGYLDDTRLSAPFAASFPSFTVAPTPTITGTAKVGSALKANAGVWVPAPSSFTYQWYRNGAAISGATMVGYTAVAADAGKKLTVKVTAKRAGYLSGSKTSAAKTVAKGTFAKAPAPKITGTVKVGSTVKASVGTWAPAPSFTYQWYRGGKAISKATKSSYKLAAADAGKKITVKVTGKKAGYADAAKTSAAKSVPLAKFAKTPVPKITGTLKVGSTLKAAPGTWSPKPSSFTYQWHRDGKAISKATKAQYKLTSKDKGKKITVKVSAKKTGYATVAKTSAKTAKVK